MLILPGQPEPKPEPFAGTMPVYATSEEELQQVITELVEVGAKVTNIVARDFKKSEAILMVEVPFGPEEFRRRLEARGGTCLG